MTLAVGSVWMLDVHLLRKRGMVVHYKVCVHMHLQVPVEMKGFRERRLRVLV